MTETAPAATEPVELGIDEPVDIEVDGPVDIDIDASAARPDAAQLPTDIDIAAGMSRWDRPHLTGWLRGVQLLGRGLFSSGVLIALFVAFLLWGTGIQTARHQSSLSSEFEAARAGRPVMTAPAGPLAAVAEDDDVATDGTVDEATTGAATNPGDSDADATTTETASDSGESVDQTGPGSGDRVDDGSPATVPLEEQDLPPIRAGDALAHLQIPAIDVDSYVVAGATRNDLKRGPGHFPETPLPGQLGNAAIAGHRATHGGPFADIDRLTVGDDIVIETINGRYLYRVNAEPFLVSRTDAWVIGTTDVDQATLTLVSCHPRWSARERIIVQAALVPDRSAAVGEPLIGYGTGAAALGSTITFPDAADDTATVSSSTAASPSTDDDSGVTGALLDDASSAPPASSSSSGNDAFTSGWFADRAAFEHLAAWGAALAIVSALSFLLSRRFRNNWIGLAAGLAPFVVCLYFFYENAVRVLPANF